MKYITLAMIFGFVSLTAHAKPAAEMTEDEYRAYIKARNDDPRWHEQLKARAEQYKAQHGIKDEKSGVYQEQENPDDPRTKSDDFRNYLKEKAEELDKSN